MTVSSSPRLAGHVLVEALIAQGVDTAFGVPGESYLAVLDGFHEHRDRIAGRDRLLQVEARLFERV
jgi:TPP-dependent 2-oxoacid decarboxylase